MQAYTWTSSLSRNDPPCPQTTARNPGPTQNGSYSVQQRTLNQQNNYQSSCLNNTYSVSASSQPNSSSANLQSSQTPAVGCTGFKNQFYSISPSYRPACPNVTAYNTSLPSGQLGTYAENLSHHPQSSYSNSPLLLTYKNMPAMQTSTVGWFPSVSNNISSAFKDNNLMYGSKPPMYQSSNVQHNIIQTTYQPIAYPQQTAPSVQISQAAQTVNITQSQMRAVGNSTSSSYSTQSSAALQGLTAPSMPQQYRTQQGPCSQGQLQSMVNQSQNSPPLFSQPVPLSAQNSHVSPSQSKYTANNDQSSSLTLPLPPPYRSHSKHRMNQNSSLSLSQGKIPSQVHLIGELLEQVQSRQTLQHRNTISVSGHCGKTTLPAIPAAHCNTGPHIQQSNGMTSELMRTSQDTTPCITPTNEAPFPTHSGPGDLSQVTQMNLLLSKDGRQVPVQRHISPLCLPSNNYEPQVSGSRGERLQAAQEQTAGQSMASSQTQTSVMHYVVPTTPWNGEIQRTKEYQVHDKATGVSMGHDRRHVSHLETQDVETRCERAQFSRFQMDSQIKESSGHMSEERQGGIQYCMDPAECLEAVMALYRVARPINRAVAVVPPISQQATSPEENVTPSTDDCLPFKIDAVWSLLKEGEDVEMKEKSQSRPTEITEDQFRVPSVPLPEMQESVKPGNGSKADIPSCKVISSENDATLGLQCVDTPQPENVPVSTSQCSNMFQNPTEVTVCSPDVASKCPLQPNDDENESNLNDSFDLAKAPLVDFTLEKLKDLVQSLELEQVEREKEKETTDVLKSILDVFWDGDMRNVQEQLKEEVGLLKKMSSELGVKDNHTVVFQYLDLEESKTSSRYHVLENETTLPTEEFKSLLYSDGKPPDIESVLAEPISDYDTSWCKDISPSLLDSTVNRESGLVQVNANDPKNIGMTTHKDVSDTTSEDISEKSIVAYMCHSEPDSEIFIPAMTDCQNKVMTLSKVPSNLLVCEGRSPNEASKKQDTSEKQEENQQLLGPVNKVVHVIHSAEIPCTLTKSNNRSQCDDKDHKSIGEDSPSPSGMLKSKPNDIIEQQVRKSNTTHAELSVSTSLVDCNVKNRCERGEISNDVNSSCDSMLMKVTLLSSDDAKMVFKEHCYHDQLRDSPQVCKDDPKDSAIRSPTEPSHVTSKSERMSRSTPSHIRFTCPHVTDVVCDDDHFCSNCWAKTPLLDIDLDAVVSIPEGDEPSVTAIPSRPGNPSQNSGPQSDKPFKDPVAQICPESEGIAVSDMLTPECDGSDVMTPYPKPDERQNCTSVFDEPQDLESLQPEYPSSRSITKPVADRICNDKSSPRAESPKDLLDIGNIGVSDLLTPRFDGSHSMTSHPKPDKGESYNSMSDEHQVQESLHPVCPSNVVTKSVADKIDEVMSAPRTGSCNMLSDIENMENVKPVSARQTKTLTRKVSPPRAPPRKKLKLNQARIMPADDLFAPDPVIKKTSVQRFTYTCNGQNSIEKKRKEKKTGEKKQSEGKKHSLVKITSQHNQDSIQTELHAYRRCQKAPAQPEVPNVCKTIQSCNAVPQGKNGSACSVLTKSTESQHKPPNDTKEAKRKDMKISLALYGPQSRSSDVYFVHRCHDQDKTSVAPAYITICSRPATSKTSTDMPTARQKVYSDWCSTFVQIKKNKKKTCVT